MKHRLHIILNSAAFWRGFRKGWLQTTPLWIAFFIWCLWRTIGERGH